MNVIKIEDESDQRVTFTIKREFDQEVIVLDDDDDDAVSEIKEEDELENFEQVFLPELEEYDPIQVDEYQQHNIVNEEVPLLKFDFGTVNTQNTLVESYGQDQVWRIGNGNISQINSSDTKIVNVKNTYACRPLKDFRRNYVYEPVAVDKNDENCKYKCPFCKRPKSFYTLEAVNNHLKFDHISVFHHNKVTDRVFEEKMYNLE